MNDSQGSVHGTRGEPAAGVILPHETHETVAIAEVVKKQAIASPERAERELQRLENEIVSEAAEMMRSVMRFSEIDPEKPEMPNAWLDEIAHLEVGSVEHEQAVEQLSKRHRIAKASWLSAKEAPVALAIGKSVLVGAMKARAMAGSAPKTLNLTMVSISAPGQAMPAFPEKEVKHE